MNPHKSDYYIIWGLVFFWQLVYLASMLYHTGGRLSLPLDDAFIYFQYARQAAAGHFLQYNIGDMPTAGATSLLYMLLLVPGFVLGLDGMTIAVYALVLGCGLLGLSAHLVLALGGALAGSFGGRVSVLLFLLCGPLLWGYASGMEIGLFSFAILLTLYLHQRGDPRTSWAAALMVLARPEGIVLALVLYGYKAYARLVRGEAMGWRWWLPAAAYAGQAALLWWVTGAPGGAGVEAKWRFAAPHGSWPEIAREVLFDYAEFLKGILSGSLGHQTSVNLYAYDGNYRRMVFAPFAALLFVAELCLRVGDEVAARRPGFALLAGAWLLAGVLVTCTLVEYDAHFNRYQQPFMPLFILFVGLALGRLVREGGMWGKKLAWGLAVLGGLWGVMSGVYFAVAYGENCSDIRNQQVEMGRFIAASLPPDARIGINDAGAQRYFGQRQTVDLVGLTSAGFSGPWRHGSGSIFEALQALPAQRRPQYLAIFPNWFNFPDGGFLRPVHRIRILEPSIIDAEKVLYAVDWDAVGQADMPRDGVAGGWRVVDALDIADLASEKRHRYQSWVRLPGDEEANLLLSLPAADGSFTDGGRTVTGGERFRMELEAGKPARLVIRTVTGVAQHFDLIVNGHRVATVDLPGGRGRQWLEQPIAALDKSATGGPIEIETVPIHQGGDLRPIVSFHYWALQP